MQTLIILVHLVALLVSFVILVSDKIGFRDRIASNANTFFYKLLTCDLCLCFWLSTVVSIVLWVFTLNATYLMIPFFSTPLSRLLL